MKSIIRIFALTCLTLTAGCGTFSGKVVDQHAEPVPQAEVCVSYTTPSITGCIFPFVPDWFSVVHHTWKKTRSDGSFRVVGLHGYNWRVTGAHGARKTGYEFTYPVEYDAAANFYVVRMRKRENPGFLHHSPYARYGFTPSEQSKAVDFIQEESVQLRPPKPRANSSWPLPALTYDVVFDAQYDSTNRTWEVDIRPQPCVSGGIIAFDKKTYTAPLDGYTNVWSFTIPVSRQATLGSKCLIIRSRTPPVYSRLDVTHVMANEDYLVLSFDRYTNPYGDRALDIDPRVEKNYSIRKQLIKDSKAAWQKGHPPQKPDFNVLLKDVDEFEEH